MVANISYFNFQLYPLEGSPSCDSSCNHSNPVCSCTHVIKAPLGDVIELVISAVRLPVTVHLHGHYFQVVKMAFPYYYNHTAGVMESGDIECEDVKCHRQRWADPRWRDGHVPGVIQVKTNHR